VNKNVKLYNIKKGKKKRQCYPITGHEMLRLQYFLDNLLTDGNEVSFTCWPLFNLICAQEPELLTLQICLSLQFQFQYICFGENTAVHLY
jgi:hypothetical protein